jgi:hypothetical protein
MLCVPTVSLFFWCLLPPFGGNFRAMSFLASLLGMVPVNKYGEERMSTAQPLVDLEIYRDAGPPLFNSQE